MIKNYTRKITGRKEVIKKLFHVQNKLRPLYTLNKQVSRVLYLHMISCQTMIKLFTFIVIIITKSLKIL